MGKHENPAGEAEIFYPPGHPKAKPANPEDDLREVILAIGRLAILLQEEFDGIPGISVDGKVPPEKFDAATRLAFVNCGNALDYAKRLCEEKGRDGRIKNLRTELAKEMTAAGMTGDPNEQDT